MLYKHLSIASHGFSSSIRRLRGEKRNSRRRRRRRRRRRSRKSHASDHSHLRVSDMISIKTFVTAETPFLDKLLE
jgi:transposase